MDYDDVFTLWLSKDIDEFYRNNLMSILDGLRVNTFSGYFHFWVNYSFKWAL